MRIALLLLIPTYAYAARKRGLGWADRANPQDMWNFNRTSSVMWVYNWSLEPSDLTRSGLEFVPMQWSGAGIERVADETRELRASEILAFNEPDFASQSNMSPAYAAELWTRYLQPLKKDGLRLGAPAVTSTPNGRDWLHKFLTACAGCKVDFLPLHWYGDGIGPFYDYLWSMHDEFKLPIWVTEFASTSTDDGTVQDFMRQTIAYLDTLYFVERYSWFGAFRQDGSNQYALLDGSGNLNALGGIYLN